MTQPPYDPILTPLQRRWNIMMSGIQEVTETMPLVVNELMRLRQENADLKKLLEDKKHGEDQP